MACPWRIAAFLLALAILTSAGAAPVSAADRAGFYTGLRLIGSVADLDGIETSGFTGSYTEQNGDDLVAGGGGVVGYRWGRWPFRTEVEIAHRVRFDWDYRDSGPPAVGYSNNLDSTNLLFNLLFEYRNMSQFTPFVGATVGWARNHSVVERTNIATSATTEQTETENNIAWGAMLGVDWAFAQKWSAELAYRYINLGDVSSGVFPTGESITADDYTSHDLLLSVMYKW
jgi:opacity protein-like surface antigen